MSLPRIPTVASGSDVKCHIYTDRMDDGIPCMVISRCNHVFHRTGKENNLANKRECPDYKRTCEQEYLRKKSFHFKLNLFKHKSKLRGFNTPWFKYCFSRY